MQTKLGMKIFVGGMVLLVITGLWVMISGKAQRATTNTVIETPVTLPSHIPLADLSQHVIDVYELVVQLPAVLAPNNFPLVTAPASDGNTLVGIIQDGNMKTAIAIDLTSGKSKIIANNAEVGDRLQVSGKWVLWRVMRQMYVYNLEDEKLQLLFSFETDYIGDPYIDGDMVVWQQYSDQAGSSEIWGYDLSTKEKLQITHRPGVAKGHPKIQGQWVLYQSWEDPTIPALWLANIQTKSDQYLGVINVDKLALPYVDDFYTLGESWASWSEPGKLHLYELESQSHTVITTQNCGVTQVGPDGKEFTELRTPAHLNLSNKILIFSCGDSFGYNLVTEQFFDLPIRPIGTENNMPEGHSFEQWTLANGKLIWILTENIGALDQTSHIYIANVK